MSEQLIAQNKKAFHDYEILERYESGIVLEGTEVKALRERSVGLSDSYARVKDGELWLENCHISPYSHGSDANHNPLRSRKLLLHRREINRLIGMITKKGLTIVPLSLYFRDGSAKMEIAVARGRRLYDKREKMRRKAIEQDVRAELKRGRR